MQFVGYVYAALALIGHLVFWMAVDNRIHAIKWPCGLHGIVRRGPMLAIVAIPVAMGWRAVMHRPVNWSATAVQPYLWLCWAAAAYGLFHGFRRMFRRPCVQLVSNHTSRLDAADRLGPTAMVGWSAQLLARVPGNQVLRPDINEKTIRLPRLPAELDGLSIVHLSDFHFNGRVSQGFFEEVVEAANDWDADLVALTGDLVDRMSCVDWIPSLLGKLTSRFGVFAVLGNHDERLREKQLVRDAIHDARIKLIGGSWNQITVRGLPVIVAGNELPWFPLSRTMDQLPSRFADDGVVRILLSHSPDQLVWARQRQFDLMLAGHTHGGQIRPPLTGAIVCPSLYGVKYARGIFYEPPTVLHVSRGISGTHPIRWNCSPEITLLVLRADKAQ